MYDKAEVPNKSMENFILQLRELRQEQKELLKEYAELRSNILKQIEPEEQKDLQSLNDDV